LSPSRDPSTNHPTNHHLAKLTPLAYINRIREQRDDLEIQTIKSSKREKQLIASKGEERESKERLKEKQLNQLIVDLVSQFDSFTASTSSIHHLQAC
jgi:hypothetical protein